MDRRDNQDIQKTQQVFGPSTEDKASEEKGSHFIMEDGKPFRMPYKVIKKVVFKNLDQKELIDIPHVARLQYRLLLFDAVIKAKVDYHKKFIRIIYNPPDADNIREKMSREKLVEFLASEGVHVKTDSADMEEEDYDYFKEHYSYAYFPPSIREAPPYGWTREEWKKEKERQAKEKYRLEHPGLLSKLLGKKPVKPGEAKQKSGLKLHP